MSHFAFLLSPVMLFLADGSHSCEHRKVQNLHRPGSAELDRFCRTLQGRLLQQVLVDVISCPDKSGKESACCYGKSVQVACWDVIFSLKLSSLMRSKVNNRQVAIGVTFQ